MTIEMNTHWEKDFDTLVEKINQHLTKPQLPEKVSVWKLLRNFLKHWDSSVQNENGKIYGDLDNHQYGVDMSWLSPYQINSLLLASDIARIFDSLEGEREKEGKWKDGHEMQQIYERYTNIENALNTLYNYHKDNFEHDKIL